MFSAASLIKSIETSKAHLVETLLAVIIQDALSNTAALQLATICLSTTSLKVRLKLEFQKNLFNFL